MSTRIVHYGYVPGPTHRVILFLEVMTKTNWGYTLFRNCVQCVTNGKITFHRKDHPWVRNETHPLILMRMIQQALASMGVEVPEIICMDTPATMLDKIKADIKPAVGMIRVDHYNQPRKPHDWMQEEIAKTPTPYKVWLPGDLM